MLPVRKVQTATHFKKVCILLSQISFLWCPKLVRIGLSACTDLQLCSDLYQECFN